MDGVQAIDMGKNTNESEGARVSGSRVCVAVESRRVVSCRAAPCARVGPSS